MTERNYNQATGKYYYAVVAKDKSRTFYFTSASKIPYKNDLIKFSLVNDQIDEKSIQLIERKYLQKYWQ